MHRCRASCPLKNTAQAKTDVCCVGMTRLSCNVTTLQGVYSIKAIDLVCACRSAQQGTPEHKAEASSQRPQDDSFLSQHLTSSSSSSSSSHDSDHDSYEDSAVDSSTVTVHCDRVTWQRQTSSTASTHAYAYR